MSHVPAQPWNDPMNEGWNSYVASAWTVIEVAGVKYLQWLYAGTYYGAENSRIYTLTSPQLINGRKYRLRFNLYTIANSDASNYLEVRVNNTTYGGDVNNHIKAPELINEVFTADFTGSNQLSIIATDNTVSGLQFSVKEFSLCDVTESLVGSGLAASGSNLIGSKLIGS